MGLFEGLEGKGKTEPPSELREMAGVAWNMYVALKDAGFSKGDALKVTTDVLTTAASQAFQEQARTEGE